MLGGLTGLLGGVSSLLGTVEGAVQDVAEGLSPGATHPLTTTGNIIGDSSIVDDVVNGLEDGNVMGAVAGVYSDIVGPGGIINNLGEGGGLGIEGLVGNLLGTTDGLLGTSDGLLGGLLGDDGGLLG